VLYWAKRQADIQEQLLKQSENKIKRQMAKYYANAAKGVIKDFENVYNKILIQQAEGKEITPALLYRLDTYWQAQAQLREELRRLGEKEIVLLTKQFELAYFDIYYSIAPTGMKAFNTIDKDAVRKLIDTVWLADGKTFSQRIWGNTEQLVEQLNEQLIHCVATGKKTSQLKNLLMERFNVSYARAETLVRTELAHIQTEAAKQRYEDYGLKQYEIMGRTEGDCGNHSVECADMDGKKFYYSEMTIGKNAPPFHPNCRCCIIPVVE
jgi:SPP1 gp7 family putative phage head morphogenesis protein